MSQKFNILFDYSIFFHQSVGGISRYITSLHKKLFNNGFDAEILSPIHQNKFLKEINTCKINKFVSHFPKNTLTICRTYNELITNIYLKFKKPKILHKTFYSGSFPSDNKIKKVINVYDLIHEKFYSDYNLNINTLPKKKYLDNVDLIFCPSQCSKKDLIEIYNINPSKIEVINIGIPELKIDNSKRPINIDFPYLLYVGYRGKYKNFKNLVIALGKDKKITEDFKIICFGGGNFTINELKLIKENNLSTKSFIHINGDDAQLISLYQNARAFIFPSIYEGQGLPQLEAMSFKCPVISSNQEAIVEATGNSAILFDPLNTDDILDKIQKTIYSEEIINSLRIKSLERSKLFSMDRCYKETLKAYQKII